MAREDKTSPRSKAGGVVLNEIQKAIRLFRLYPHEHPLCEKALDESLEQLNKFVERYGPLQAEVTRDGLMIDEALVVRTGDASSDLSALLFPEGIRGLDIETALPRAELVDFIKIVSAHYPENESEVTFEQDLATALWRRDFERIEYRVHDQLSPAMIGGHLDSTVAAVARRIQEIAGSIGNASEAAELDVKSFLEQVDERARAGKLDDAANWATLPDKVPEYLASSLGTGRRALAAELEGLSQAELIDRTSAIVVWGALEEREAPEAADVAAFLGAAAFHALTKGDLTRATTLVERAQAADRGTGAVAGAVATRLATDAGMGAIASALESQASGLAPEALGERGLAILRHLGAPALDPACKLYGTLQTESVRGAFRAFLALQVDAAPEAVVSLTLHAERRIVEEAVGLLARGGPSSPSWKHVQTIARATDGKPRTQIATEVLERLTGEKERKDIVRVVANDADKAKRLAAAEQLKASGGGAKSFDELAAYVVEDRFAARDEDEVDAVLSALTSIGKLRAVRVLTSLAEKKALLFRRGEVKKVAQIAQKKLEQLKGRGGA